MPKKSIKELTSIEQPPRRRRGAAAQVPTRPRSPLGEENDKCCLCQGWADHCCFLFSVRFRLSGAPARASCGDYKLVNTVADERTPLTPDVPRRLYKCTVCTYPVSGRDWADVSSNMNLEHPMAASAIQRRGLSVSGLPDRVAQLYYAHGLFCASHPRSVILLSIVIILICWYVN
ncbi:hypothetical protein B566_EDAN013378 [Ephemera danica]|nr:hypothetical protein B566_EDAN013378 [Ephemera danica]